MCRSDRVAEVEAVIREEVRRHAHVDVHQGKTQVWNRGGNAPDGIELTRVAKLVKPRGVEGRFVFAHQRIRGIAGMDRPRGHLCLWGSDRSTSCTGVDGPAQLAIGERAVIDRLGRTNRNT